MYSIFICSGMTYQLGMESVPPPSYSSSVRPSSHTLHTAANQAHFMHIGPDSSVLYQTVPYGLPPSYESVSHMAPPGGIPIQQPPAYQSVFSGNATPQHA